MCGPCQTTQRRSLRARVYLTIKLPRVRCLMTPGVPLHLVIPGMPYKYDWEVADDEAGLNFGQEENSDGAVVTGSYRVLLPDGRTQVVR